jgi:hypothetical protein
VREAEIELLAILNYFKKRKASWSYASMTQYELLLALNYFVIKTLAAFLSHGSAVVL